jgi:hypothetical protein
MFTEAEKLSVFSYSWQGAKIFVDPLRMQWALDIAAGGSLQQLLRKVNSPELGIADPALERLAFVVCQAFKLGRPFDPSTGEGVLYGDWIAVLREFTDWLDVKKKRDTASPPVYPDSSTCSEPTEETLSVPSGFVSPTSIGSRSI